MAAIRCSGLPQRPKPPLITTAPSLTSRMASSALETTLFIERSDLWPFRSPLHHHRDSLSPADAKRGHAAPLVQVLHRVEQRHHQARAGGADRVPEHHRAAPHVHLGGVELEQLIV